MREVKKAFQAMEKTQANNERNKEAAQSNLLAARSAAINAAVKFRDLDYCRLAGIITEQDAELLEATDAANATAAAMVRARAVYAHWHAQADEGAKQLTKLANAADQEAKLEKLKIAKPELLAELEAAEADEAALTDPANTGRPTRRASGAAAFAAGDGVRGVRARIEAELAA